MYNLRSGSANEQTSPIMCSGCAIWAKVREKIRGSHDHMKTRILHSGSAAQPRQGGFQAPMRVCSKEYFRIGEGEARHTGSSEEEDDNLRKRVQRGWRPAFFWGSQF